MSSKFERLARKVRRWVRDQLEDFVPQDPETQDEHAHPGRAYHARTEVKRRKVREYRSGPEFKGNPHAGSWRRYTEHLFKLILDGHGRSQAAMQVRDRLNFHWRFMNKTERAEAVAFYYEKKQEFAHAKAERDIADKVNERSRTFTRDLYAEVDEFMNPRAN